MANNNPRPHEQPGTGAESIPPGATRKAWDRPENPPGGPPGSGAGPRHMSGDPGDGNELSEAYDRHREGDPTMTEEPEVSDDEVVFGTVNQTGVLPYSGHAGGAVGGTPAEGRASGGNIHRGIAPGGTHRGDSTVGTNPEGGSGKSAKRSQSR